jgi:hypothetical protein
MRVVSGGNVATISPASSSAALQAKRVHNGAKNKSKCDVQTDSACDDNDPPKKQICRQDADVTQYEMFDEIDAQDIEDNWYLQNLFFLSSHFIPHISAFSPPAHRQVSSLRGSPQKERQRQG